MKRTAAIAMLAVIAWIAGIAALFDTFRYLELFFSPLSFLGAPLLGAAFAGIAALIWFWAGYMVWNVNPQGWLFMVSIAVIYLVIDIVAVIAGTPIELLSASIFLSALALILCLLPGTKREFGTT